jgi:hypothetical protein
MNVVMVMIIYFVEITKIEVQKVNVYSILAEQAVGKRLHGKINLWKNISEMDLRLGRS